MKNPKIKAVYQALTVLILLLVSVNMVVAQVYVKGYYRSNGTYVKGHYRTSPDGNPYNNYSFPGNYNPNTGKITGGNKSTYLKNYYDNDTSSGSRVWVDGYYRKDGIYVRGHYRTKPDGIKSNNYSYPGNYNPNTGEVTSGSSSSYSSTYNSDTYSSVNYSKLNQEYESSEIINIQRALKSLGYEPGPIDGVIGPKTVRAILLYRQDKNNSTSYIPNNASKSIFGDGWTCNRGYKKIGDQCAKVDVPANASISFYGDDWTCNRGYKEVNNRCSKVDVPENASISFYGDDWVCNRGYKKTGNRCTKVDVPANASISFYGDDWTCNRGYKRVGSKCEKVQVPANASISFYGDDWVCNRGFKKVGSRCVKIDIPANASLSYFGDDWVCNRGYERVGSRCIK